MKNIVTFLSIVVVGAVILTACAQPLVVESGSATPVINPTETQISTEPAAGEQIIVTMVDQGKTISLGVGEDFLLKLGEDYTWDITISDQSVLSRLMNISVIRGAQGVYEAHQTGTVTLTATGEPLCQQFKPPCEMLSVFFEMTVVVTG